MAMLRASQFEDSTYPSSYSHKQPMGVRLLSLPVGGEFKPYLGEVGNLNQNCQVFLVE